MSQKRSNVARPAKSGARQRRYRERHREQLRVKARQRHRSDPRHAMLAAAKSRAGRDGVPFDLTIADLKVPRRCPYLGLPLAINRGHAADSSPSLDRLVPALGYVSGNVVIVSYRANSIKRDSTPDELEQIARAVRRELKRAGAVK